MGSLDSASDVLRVVVGGVHIYSEVFSGVVSFMDVLFGDSRREGDVVFVGFGGCNDGDQFGGHGDDWGLFYLHFAVGFGSK